MPTAIPSAAVASDLAGQVARLFYDRGLSKVEIAERLGISRFRVARLIDQALADGLVRIEYRDTPDQDRAAAREIEERFGLDLCIVAGPEAARRDPVEQTARLAASVAGELLGPGQRLGIAWGSTLAAVVDEFPPRQDPTATVVQLAGSSSRLGRGLDPPDLSRRLADRLGAIHRPLYAPAIVESAELRDALVRQPDIAGALAEFERLSMALVGIGAMPARRDPASSSLLRSGILGPDIQLLRDQCFYKPSRCGGEVYMHQDNRYWHLDPPDAVVVFIALDDCTTATGCVHYIPGSHRWGRVDHIRAAQGRSILLEAVADKSQSVPMELPAGCASLHHCQVLHWSPPNRSSQPRRAHTIEYVASGVTCRGQALKDAPLLRGSLRGDACESSSV